MSDIMSMMCKENNKGQSMVSCRTHDAMRSSLVLPILEYGGLSFDPHCNGLNGKLENVLKRAARFMMRNYSRDV